MNNCIRCGKKLTQSDIESQNINLNEEYIECDSCLDLCPECDTERNEEVKLVSFWLMKDGSIKPDSKVSEDDHLNGLIEDIWRVTCPKCGYHSINLRELGDE